MNADHWERVQVSSLKKPTLDEVRTVLSQREAIIVHCSGTPKGIGPGKEPYPADLRHVFEGHAQGGISCSVIKPGDRFHPPGSHTTGSVGLVVALTGSSSLVAVAPHDAGSSEVNGVRTVGREADISKGDLERSIDDRGDYYNEWVLRDFKVVGVFVARPAITWQKVAVEIPPELVGQLDPLQGQGVEISVQQVAKDFKGLPVYTLSTEEILCWDGCDWSPVTHSDLYTAVHEENYGAVDKQHVLPKASIDRFLVPGENHVEVFLKAQGRSAPASPKRWKGFKVGRKWDERMERVARFAEAEFQALANLVVAGKNSMTLEESYIVTRFWVLISERSRARRHTFSDELMFTDIEGGSLPQARQDFLENEGILMGGDSGQIDRAVYGLTQIAKIIHADTRPRSWRVVRAKEGQFLVPDNYHLNEFVPVDPRTFLSVGDKPASVERERVEQMNKSWLDSSDVYVFAQSLQACGVGLVAPDLKAKHSS